MPRRSCAEGRQTWLPVAALSNGKFLAGEISVKNGLKHQLACVFPQCDAHVFANHECHGNRQGCMLPSWHKRHARAKASQIIATIDELPAERAHGRLQNTGHGHVVKRIVGVQQITVRRPAEGLSMYLSASSSNKSIAVLPSALG
jgi:hypothetical protein